MPTLPGFEWWTKGGDIGIGEWSATSDDVSAPGADVVIRYYGPRYPDDFVENNMTQESEIPSQFHKALYAHVLMEFYAEEGDDRAAGRWERIWRRAVRDGNAYAFKEKRTGPVRTLPHDF